METKLDNRADDPAIAGHERRVDQGDEKGRNENNAARYYFLFAASDQPPTRNRGVHSFLRSISMLRYNFHSFLREARS